MPAAGPIDLGDDEQDTSTGTPLEKTVALARRQHGVISVKQLRDNGISPRQIRTRMARGEWARVVHGVYRIGASQATWEAQLQAHLLAAGSDAVASHRTAAVLHGLEGFHRATPEISIPRHRSYRHPAVKVHRSNDLHLVSFETRDGLQVTSPVRTLLDLAGVVPPSKVHRALEDALRRDLVSWTGVTRCLVAHARHGRPGIAPLRSIVDKHRDEVVATESGFEFLVSCLLQEAGLPPPVPQHPVELAGRAFRVDLAYPADKLAIELDGSVHREKPTFETDRPRQNALILAGWTVLRYTWGFYVRRSSTLVSEVRAAIGENSPVPVP
jgi:hypothetical protein